MLGYIGGQAPPGGAKPPARITKREIARAFGVQGDAKADLKRLISDLEADGAIARGRKSLHRPDRLPALVVADIVERDRDGELIARPAEWSEDGDAPRILVHRPRGKRESGAAPGLGARALLRVEFDADAAPGEPAYSGRVVRIIDKAKARTLGVYRRSEGGGGRALPVEKRGAPREIVVPPGMAGEAADGDLVALEPLREGRLGLPTARVVERLGSLKSEKAISLIALSAASNSRRLLRRGARRSGAGARRGAWISARTGAICRSSPSIRPTPRTMTTRFTRRPTPTPPTPAASCSTVAIADVAHYVRPGSFLDREALERGNSVYFPDRVVPMLPERISNDLCSLRPGLDRPALAVRMIDRRRRTQARATLPPHHDALGRQAQLRAGASARSTASPTKRPRRCSRPS